MSSSFRCKGGPGPTVRGFCMYCRIFLFLFSVLTPLGTPTMYRSLSLSLSLFANTYTVRTLFCTFAGRTVTQHSKKQVSKSILFPKPLGFPTRPSRDLLYFSHPSSDRASFSSFPAKHCPLDSPRVRNDLCLVTPYPQHFRNFFCLSHSNFECDVRWSRALSSTYFSTTFL